MAAKTVATALLLTVLSGASPVQAASRAMVVTSQHLATDVGIDILKAGGNAVDAAAAVAYAEAVVNPCCGNIGGGGFMLLRLKGRNIFLDFRETAPLAATADIYLDADGKPVKDASLFGFRAVGVPGTVAGLEKARKAYGRLTRARIIAPAIRLAREGFVLTKGDTDILQAQTQRFRQNPELARIFLRPDGTPLQPGDLLVQHDLARTLDAIAQKGADAFYKGKTARAIVQASRTQDGFLTAQDFTRYRARTLPPVQCRYRGLDVISAPPPSSGGTALCEILNVLEGYDLKALGQGSAGEAALLIEAMRHAYADRNEALGDPAFVNNPVARLLSPQHAADIRARINARLPGPKVQHVSRERPETTHFSILDKDGNAASVTYTLNGSFGAMAMAAGTGVLLNNEMDDFTIKPGVANQFGLVQGASNAIAPGKRPLSSMSPTIVLKDGKPFLILGSPGGSRIITATLLALINVVDHGLTPQQAVDAPRLHYQGLPDRVFVEAGALDNAARSELTVQGYVLEEQAPWCAVELIQIADDGVVTGANDRRRPAGSARGDGP